MSRVLHNQLPFAIMRYVHNRVQEPIIVPVPLPLDAGTAAQCAKISG